MPVSSLYKINLHNHKFHCMQTNQTTNIFVHKTMLSTNISSSIASHRTSIKSNTYMYMYIVCSIYICRVLDWANCGVDCVGLAPFLVPLAACSIVFSHAENGRDLSTRYLIRQTRLINTTLNVSLTISASEAGNLLVAFNDYTQTYVPSSNLSHSWQEALTEQLFALDICIWEYVMQYWHLLENNRTTWVRLVPRTRTHTRLYTLDLT